MKIGVMLRTMDGPGGIGVYTRNLMDHLLPLDENNQYVLFYRNPDFLGRYARHGHVREKLVRATNAATWDQVSIPLEAHREGVEVIFHTKFTVPLSTRRKTVMMLHGSAWFTHPELFRRLDMLYVRRAMPLYCRRATAILANSDVTARDFVRYLGVSPEKIHTTHLAANDRFRPIRDPLVLARAKEKFQLPDRYMLCVIAHDPRKNFKNLIRAFTLCRDRVPCKLVVVGPGCERYREEPGWREMGVDRDVTFLGRVAQEELPPLYSLAELMFFPSVYEAFGIPVCEAMACGCPMVVARTGALPETAGEAGMCVDPMNPAEMADTLYALWTDDGLRRRLAEKGLARSRQFSWAKCARETLAVFETLAGGNVGSRVDPRPYSPGSSAAGPGSPASPTCQTS